MQWPPACGDLCPLRRPRGRSWCCCVSRGWPPSDPLGKLYRGTVMRVQSTGGFVKAVLSWFGSRYSLWWDLVWYLSGNSMVWTRQERQENVLKYHYHTSLGLVSSLWFVLFVNLVGDNKIFFEWSCRCGCRDKINVPPPNSKLSMGYCFVIELVLNYICPASPLVTFNLRFTNTLTWIVCLL